MTKKQQQRVESLFPNGVPRYVRCYDNGGESADRYTVVFTGRYTHATGGSHWYLGMSASPFHPLGVGMHGASDRQIDYPSYKHLGKKVDFSTLPEDCKKCAIQTYKELWDI